ncbi:Mor transcription activator family protein [Marinobacterium litorale]|uniref:Mor transcription activator family protein n=1 Tax=Marinobacterium litorale TaxID=404770 RepID=UPI000412DDAF|nr:Mor transcription activator family protein [Marinobacterium litorale]
MARDGKGMEGRRHELLEDVHARAAEVAKELGIDPDLADQIGCAIADHLAQNWGGQNFTIPMDYHYRIGKRDSEIYDLFTGNNHHILAREFGMTVRGIYKVIARVRANGDPDQHDLF